MERLSGTDYFRLISALRETRVRGNIPGPGDALARNTEDERPPVPERRGSCASGVARASGAHAFADVGGRAHSWPVDWRSLGGRCARHGLHHLRGDWESRVA